MLDTAGYTWVKMSRMCIRPLAVERIGSIYFLELKRTLESAIFRISVKYHKWIPSLRVKPHGIVYHSTQFLIHDDSDYVIFSLIHVSAWVQEKKYYGSFQQPMILSTFAALFPQVYKLFWWLSWKFGRHLVYSDHGTDLLLNAKTKVQGFKIS